MSHNDIVFFAPFAVYGVLVLLGFLFRGVAASFENEDIPLHFGWPLLIILAIAAIPVGIVSIGIKAFKEGIRIFKVIMPRQALKDTEQ